MLPANGAGITNAASAGDPRLANVTSYPARDITSYTSTLNSVQAGFVARRFGLHVDRALLVAHLAFEGAAR